MEQARIHYYSLPGKVNLAKLVDWIFEKPGPRLLILNTVQSAAVTAQYISENFDMTKVEHLSTALTPLDRTKTLRKIKARLKNKFDEDWCLVATSCVEAGVDLSFKTGFRERCSLVSLLQTGGRINRENTHIEAEIWDFSLLFNDSLKKHPAFEDSGRILGELFDADKVSPDYCCEALKREIRQSYPHENMDKIDKAEKNLDFPNVEQLFKVINSYTVTALANQEIIDRLKNWQPVSRDEIQKNSVQIWSYKKDEWALEEISQHPGLFYWRLEYDEFLGYMKGAIVAENAKHGYIPPI